MTDELSAPLGQGRKTKRRVALPKAVPRILVGLLGLALAGFAAWAIFADDPLGGEPYAVASTTGVAAPGKPAKNPTVASARPDHAASHPSAATDGQTITIINGMSGKQERVPIGAVAAAREQAAIVAAATAPKTAVTKPPAATPAAPKPTTTAMSAPARDPFGFTTASTPPPTSAHSVSVDASLITPSPQGGIPRISDSGARSAEVYASPQAKAAAGIKGPRIALVVDRLGISAGGTTEALAKLPAAVTLGFPPYGTDLGRWVLRARGEGHEVLLQVPMEPFDYPDNDSGPQTLLTTLSPAQNADRLHWAMSRFQGYVGIASYMGERFVTNAAAVTPVVKEAATRGLIYFDDGAAARSATAQAAGAKGAYVKADVSIGAASTPAAIDAALSRLEAIARQRGSAVGAATAAPDTVARIAAWSKALAAHGVTLVPLTALVNKPKSS